MGIAYQEVRLLFERGIIGPGSRVLDIGCSNLCEGLSEDYADLIRRYGEGTADEVWLARYSRLLSIGATRHPIAGGVNGSWLGNLLEQMGCLYTAFDIFPGYKTVIFDLNEEDLPEGNRGSFDLVINCGTTEHVLNQYRSFKTIHDAVAPGGYIYCALPMLGYLNHGYVNYNPRLFVELSRANGYRIELFDLLGPNAPRDFNSAAKQSIPDDHLDLDSVLVKWDGVTIADVGLQIIIQKLNLEPFRVPFEVSTTVGGMAALPANIKKFNGKNISQCRGP
jgi:SAM-dependent methyltransferase